METKYIHASSRAKALEAKLLSETQVELLLSSKETSETFKVLQDTFLAPYLAEHERSDINTALDESMFEAKKILASITPEPGLLDILWIKYDFYNLKAIVKGKKASLENDEIKKHCSSVGKYNPDVLIKAYEDKKLYSINKYFNNAVEEATSAKEVFEIDIAMNINYFKAIKDISKKFKNKFVNEYISILIDFFNIEASLRVLSLENLNIKNIFVDGGTLQKENMESPEQTLELYKKFGGEKLWDEPIKIFKDTGDFSLLEKTADEYVVSFLKEKSMSIMSPAPMFAYFAAKKNNAQTIRAIIVAKQVGMPEHDIRVILRRLYT
jgi:vacuolar-type H+-ATPase subunit C/Vma6